MIELQNDRIPSNKFQYAINKKGLCIAYEKKVITSQQFMRAEINDGLVDDKS